MKRINYKNVFLIDAAGALISMCMLGFVLIRLQQWIGMPVNVLYLLAAIASLFFIYSTLMYIIRPIKWQVFLWIIAFSNLSYCGFTLLLVVINYDGLTPMGLTYFGLEMMVIVGLSTYEINIARSGNS